MTILIDDQPVEIDSCMKPLIENLKVFVNWTYDRYHICYRIGKRTLFLHRYLMGIRPGDKRLVRFKDGNQFNLRISNLELSDNSLSQMKRNPPHKIWKEYNRFRFVFRARYYSFKTKREALKALAKMKAKI